MHHFFLPAPLSEEALAAPLTFSRKDWQHLFVLRLREGEEFVLADGRGREHICRVTDVQKNSLTASVVASRDSARELDCQLILLQGLPKRDKLELIIQKAVELGASSIVPVMMARSNVRLDDKKADRKAERLAEIAKSAAEQSKRGILPQVASPKRFADAIALAKDADIKLICYEDETAAGRHLRRFSERQPRPPHPAHRNRRPLPLELPHAASGKRMKKAQPSQPTAEHFL